MCLNDVTDSGTSSGLLRERTCEKANRIVAHGDHQRRGRKETVKPKSKVVFVDCQQKSVGPPIQGDRQALESLLSRYSSVLYRMALRQLHNPEDAEDAVQDALLSALKHISQFEGRSQISSWLTGIVINSARMLLRRRSREKNISLEQTQEEQNLIFADQFVDTRPSPEEICEQAELREILNELLKQLSPLRRGAFQLCEIDALSTSEAAQVLGVTQTAVKSRLFQARTKLSVLLPVAVGTPRPVRTRITEVAQAESLPKQIRETNTCSTRAPPFTLPCFLDSSAPKSGFASGGTPKSSHQCEERPRLCQS
jgi:RNA polymerase sigma-70 factor, ECF subfamily